MEPDVKKSELAKRILNFVGDLESTYVSDFNKKVLLGIADSKFTGEIDGNAVKTAEELLLAFLNDTWPEKPQAHKYMIGSCLVQAFLFQKPMHPQEKANYVVRIENGREYYFCPYNEAGTICDFCAANPMEEKLNK